MLELVVGLGNVPELDDVLVVTPDQLELLEVEDVLDVLELELVELLEVEDVLVPLLDVPWNIFWPSSFCPRFPPSSSNRSPPIPPELVELEVLLLDVEDVLELVVGLFIVPELDVEDVLDVDDVLELDVVGSCITDGNLHCNPPSLTHVPPRFVQSSNAAPDEVLELELDELEEGLGNPELLEELEEGFGMPELLELDVVQ